MVKDTIGNLGVHELSSLSGLVDVPRRGRHQEPARPELKAAVALAVKPQLRNSAGLRPIFLQTHQAATPALLSHRPATMPPGLSCRAIFLFP